MILASYFSSLVWVCKASPRCNRVDLWEPLVWSEREGDGAIIASTSSSGQLSCTPDYRVWGHGGSLRAKASNADHTVHMSSHEHALKDKHHIPRMQMGG